MAHDCKCHNIDNQKSRLVAMSTPKYLLLYFEVPSYGPWKPYADLVRLLILYSFILLAKRAIYVTIQGKLKAKAERPAGSLHAFNCAGEGAVPATPEGLARDGCLSSTCGVIQSVG